jgi:hypothetical protein
MCARPTVMLTLHTLAAFSQKLWLYTRRTVSVHHIHLLVMCDMLRIMLCGTCYITADCEARVAGAGRQRPLHRV